MTGWEPEGGWAVPPEQPAPPPPAYPPPAPPYQAAYPSEAPPYPPQAPPYEASPYQAAYVPQPQAPAPLAGRAHPIGTLATVLAIMLTLAVFVQVAGIAALSERADLVDDLRRINTLEPSIVDRAEDVEARVSGAAALANLTWLVCGIVWIWWQRRFVRNASRFGPISPSLGWGSWGWIVPIANFFYPQAQLANATRRTDPHQLLGRTGICPPVVYVWWVLFVGANMLGIAANLTEGDALDALTGSTVTLGSIFEALDRLERSTQLASLSYWVTAVAALAAAATVLVCTDRQRKLLTALGVQS